MPTMPTIATIVSRIGKKCDDGICDGDGIFVSQILFTTITELTNITSENVQLLFSGE